MEDKKKQEKKPAKKKVKIPIELQTKNYLLLKDVSIGGKIVNKGDKVSLTEIGKEAPISRAKIISVVHQPGRPISRIRLAIILIQPNRNITEVIPKMIKKGKKVSLTEIGRKSFKKLNYI